MTKVFYPAVIEGDDSPGYSVFFPDLPGCVSAGDTVQQAARNAIEALTAHIESMEEDGDAVPTASELDAVSIDPDIKVEALVLLPVDVKSTKTRPVNITLPEDLIARIDAVTGNRSHFLAQAAEARLAPAKAAAKARPSAKAKATKKRRSAKKAATARKRA